MVKDIILGVIQVRFGSTRFPQKAFKEISAKPVLWHIYNRLTFSKLLDSIAIATADTKENFAIIEFARRNSIRYFAGSETDLVSRLYKTAEKFNAKAIVRITGDCPLVDPELIDKMVNFYLGNEDKYDYISNTIKPTYPDGLDIDIIPFNTLARMQNELNDPFWREWLTSYIKEHPKKYKQTNIENDIDLSHMRWTLDYEEDFIFMQNIFSRLYKNDGVFLMQDILKLLEQEPQLCDINKKYARDQGYYKAKTEASR